MDEHTWERVKRLFDEAQHLTEDQRRRLVARVEAEEPEVAAELESLLAAHQRAGAGEDMLEEGTTSPFAHAIVGRSLAGRTIGAYRLLEQIGGGGMGVVYLAERADGQFDKKVAVKLIRPGMDTGEIMQRFELERHTLASLEHPNIARLLDAGTTGDGQPYLVMEYVEGEPIDAYCDSHRLDTTARLHLLLTVCEAVQYAHRNLLVHRDLKPDNILVTATGEVKLLDFGIVKLLSAERTVPLTAASERIMTPGYASPEQLLGRPVSTASDVYSLGVVAYVLLTGHPPYRFSGRDPRAMERIVCESIPQRPSIAVLAIDEDDTGPLKGRPAPRPEDVAATREGSIERLRRRLAGDIDLIVLTTLRKEPERRYPSVGHLAEDIRRHLEDLPITARQDSVVYRWGLFLRRHTLGAIAGGIIAILLFAGVAATAWQAGVAARERDRARAEAQKALAINDFLQNMLTSVDPELMGRDVTVAEVLDRASATVANDLAGQPAVEATVRTNLGRTYHSLGRYDHAGEQLGAAVELTRWVYGESHMETAAALTHLGILRHDQGQLDTADLLYRQALRIQQELGMASSLEAAETLNATGALRRAQGRDLEAEQSYREALRLFHEHLGNEHRQVAMVTHNLAVLNHGKGELSTAEAFYREALAITRVTDGDDSLAVARVLHNLGSVLHSRHRWAEAESLYREALELRRSLLGPDHPQLALSLVDLADVLTTLDKLAEAESLAREGLDLDQRILPENHPLLARALVVLAEVTLAQGDPVAAETSAHKALSIRRKILPPNHWLTANAEVLLGRCLAVQGRFAEGETLLKTGYGKLLQDRGEEHELTVAAREALKELVATAELSKGPRH